MSMNSIDILYFKKITFFMKKFSPKSNANNSGQTVCKIVKSLHVPRAN